MEPRCLSGRTLTTRHRLRDLQRGTAFVFCGEAYSVLGPAETGDIPCADADGKTLRFAADCWVELPSKGCAA